MTLGLIEADAAHAVKLTSTYGAILDGNAAAVNIRGGSANLTAVRIGDAGDAIDTDIDTLTAVGTSGGVFIKEATALTKKMLDLLGLASFLKTSGGKGLHVVVPLTPKWDYDPVKDFSEKLVQHMARTIPKLFVAKSGARNRVGRIFIDYLRNGKGATTAAAFSARARPGLGVSVPVAWRELGGLEAANQWDIHNVFERLKRQRTDPWKDYWGTKQTLEGALRKLGQA